ncbi:MAG: M48 family metalloprotease [Alphaproteobacteria bacterium]|nr:M48 family metalloprotease [Alphaproteobacteria bacterium]
MNVRLRNSLIHFLHLFFLGAALFSFSKFSHAQGLSIIRDTEIENILRSWGTPIFKSAELNPEAINIILVNNNDVNAFVAGGSNIFFYSGLILKTEGPGEVIGVLAHETGHISGGHLVRTREALERASYESIIGFVVGLGAAIASGEAGAAPAISAGGASVAQRRFFAHSRVHESSADQAALTYMEKAGINPSGLATFMDKLKAENYIPENQRSEYIRTHPLAENRVAALERRIEMSDHKNASYPNLWIEQHARMRAKLVSFINPGQVPWVYDDKDKSIAAQYARAIAAYRNNQVDEALSRINDLLKREPENPYFLELKGQMLVDFGRVKEAVPVYQKSINLLPKAPLIRIAFAHALIESASDNQVSKLNQAIDELNIALRDEPRSTRVHRLLATAHGRLGSESEAKLHLAEEAVLQRRFSYAKQHAQAVLQTEEEGSSLWIRARDVLSFIEVEEKK